METLKLGESKLSSSHSGLYEMLIISIPGLSQFLDLGPVHPDMIPKCDFLEVGEEGL